MIKIKKLFFVLVLAVLVFSMVALVGCDGDGDFDLFSAFRMGSFDPAGVQGYDFVDEDAGGDELRLPADRGAIYYPFI